MKPLPVLDPKAAANAIRAFTRMSGIQVSTASLEKEAIELSKTIKESVIKARISKKKGPSAEEGGSMFQ
jgi:predicted ATP-grasp superfamily ATP-dependent carboligase